MIDKLPFKAKIINDYDDYTIIKSDNNTKYIILKINQNEYNIYYDLIKHNIISKSIFEFKIDNIIYLLISEIDEMTEDRVKLIKIFSLANDLFTKTNFEVTLKKEHLKNLNKLYQVLDHRFTYFEFRIREIEVMPIKNDISWIILSKYNIILDAKIYLYDLQQDIFKFIDKNEIIKYGLIYNEYNKIMYQNSHLLPFFDLFYGPISTFYYRYFFSFLEEIDINTFKKELKRVDKFNQKLFCFMSLYVLILNLNIPTILNNNTIDNYITLTKVLKKFMINFNDFFK